MDPAIVEIIQSRLDDTSREQRAAIPLDPRPASFIDHEFEVACAASRRPATAVSRAAIERAKEFFLASVRRLT